MYAKSIVLKGASGKEKTRSGLRKEDLMKNKRGKVVSKKSAMHGRSAYKYISKWTAAVVAAVHLLMYLYALLPCIADFFETTLPRLFFIRSSFLRPEAVFTLPFAPLKIRAFAYFPFAILLTLFTFFFIAPATFITFIARIGRAMASR